ncbi:MAG: ATP-binding protein [Pleurocapsa sp.]
MSHTAALKREIIKRLGFFPSFLIPALATPQILSNLYQQTLLGYINNPLPAVFKEKLFVNLSRFFQVNYLVICHSCTLRSLGMTAEEINSLENFTIPESEIDIQADFQILEQQITQNCQNNWHQNLQLENIILRCAALIFIQPYRATNCRIKLQKFLGVTNYNHLILLLNYIKLCHHWIISHPEISYKQDKRAQLHLASLLLENNQLVNFFRQDNFKHNLNIIKTKQIVKKNCEDLHIALSRQKLKREKFKMCFINAPFPIAIYENKAEDNGRILHLNRNWIEVTGYDLVQTPTLQQWKQKAAVKQQDIVRSHQISWESETSFQQIVTSLFNLPPNSESISDKSTIVANCQTPTNSAIRSEVALITSKGEKRFWELYSAPLAIDSNGVPISIAIAKDITHCVQNEAKLAEAETRLKLILEATKTGSWNWNLETNQVEICHRARAILGLKNFNHSYESFLESIYDTERESVDLAAIKTVKAGKDLELEYRIVKPDNSVRWIKTTGKLNYDYSGKATQLTGIVRDITEQKQTQQQLEKLNQYQQQEVAQSLDELENLLNLIPYYLFVLDVKTQCISVCNLGLSQSLGYVNSQQVQGKAIADCFSPENARRIMTQHERVLQSQSVLRLQESIVLPDGNHYFDTVITPLINAEGEIYALLHTSSDIPDLAATQQALSERTAQLEAANKELESFSYSVSHDLQAPLRRINSFSEVLWEQYHLTLDDRAKHYLQRIQANSERMSQLIDSLLQLSRITRSKMGYNTIDLSVIATEIVNELKTANPQREVKFITPTTLMATGDPQLLRIVLNNLLDNAWKYTSKRENATIEFNAMPADDDKVIYFIRDNGAGFDRNYVNKLFKAFQRLHSESEFPGTGIGLATVQRIIYRHGGKVWAEGEAGQGATFYFSL